MNMKEIRHVTAVTSAEDVAKQANIKIEKIGEVEVKLKDCFESIVFTKYAYVEQERFLYELPTGYQDNYQVNLYRSPRILSKEELLKMYNYFK